MKLRPMADRLIVRPIEPETETQLASGLIVKTDAIKRDEADQAEVVSVGPGRTESGIRVPIDLAPGNIVLYSKFAGTEINVEGEKLMLIREHDVMAASE